MGLLWNETDAFEEQAVRHIHRRSRRAFLCALVLSGLLILPLLRFSGKGRWLIGALFVWSLVVTFYVARNWLAARSYYKRKREELGVTDALTRLPNRKGLMAALESVESGQKEFGRRVRLIDIDLINLNRVNYEFGQMVGDAVLQDIAELLQKNAPSSCIVGRLGGDEFLVAMPDATQADADSLAESLEEAIASYRLDLGERGEVDAIKARISVADYMPERASLHETVISAKEATAHGRIVQQGEEGGFSGYHLPRVTLGAFAAHRWQSLEPDEQKAFKLWKAEPTREPPEDVVGDVLRLLEEKAEVNWADFVTAVPSTKGPRAAHAARILAEAVAKRMGIPYRDVMRVDASGPESRSVQPAVDAVIDKGDGVLLISDVVSSGIVERRCVKTLSAAGAHVQVIAWAGY